MTVSQSPEELASILSGHIRKDRIAERLQTAVRIPSENPPGDEAEIAEAIADMCRESGLEPELYEAAPGRPSVLASWGSGEPPHLVFCSHIDVVPAGDSSLWDDDPYSGAVRDGRLHGRGSGDAKGPVIAGLEAAAALAASGISPAGTLTLALVADEETMGFKGAGPLVSEGMVPTDIAIVGEPTSLGVVRAERGASWFRITTRGKAVHASAPEKGRSAIRHMAEVIAHLPDTLSDLTHELLGGPSINVGTISGGEKVNIVPASCVIEIDRRSVPGETEESITAEIQAAVDLARERFPDLDAEIELQFHARPFEIDEGAGVVQAMKAAVSVVRGDAEVIGLLAASDGRFFAEAGADVIVCGPGDISLAHTASEYVELAEVNDAALAYAIAFATMMGS